MTTTPPTTVDAFLFVSREALLEWTDCPFDVVEGVGGNGNGDAPEEAVVALRVPCSRSTLSELHAPLRDLSIALQLAASHGKASELNPDAPKRYMPLAWAYYDSMDGKETAAVHIAALFLAEEQEGASKAPKVMTDLFPASARPYLRFPLALFRFQSDISRYQDMTIGAYKAYVSARDAHGAKWDEEVEVKDPQHELDQKKKQR